MLMFDDYQSLNQKDKMPSHFVYDQLVVPLKVKDFFEHVRSKNLKMNFNFFFAL